MSAERTAYGGEFILISALQPVQRKLYERLPSHVTLVPWFLMPFEELEPMQHELRRVADGTEPLNIVGKLEDQFGSATVRLVGNAALRPLHDELLRIVRDEVHGKLSHTAYVGEHYRPHVTKKPEMWLDQGEEVVLRGMQLASRSIPHGEREIIANYEFRG
jgi:hypothetical protein